MKLLYATVSIQGLPESALKTEAEEELLLNRTERKMYFPRALKRKEVLMRESKVANLLHYQYNSVFRGNTLLSFPLGSNSFKEALLPKAALQKHVAEETL